MFSQNHILHLAKKAIEIHVCHVASFIYKNSIDQFIFSFKENHENFIIDLNCLLEYEQHKQEFLKSKNKKRTFSDFLNLK